MSKEDQQTAPVREYMITSEHQKGWKVAWIVMIKNIRAYEVQS